MKKNSKWITAVAVAALSATMAFAAAPHDGGQGGWHGKGHHGFRAGHLAKKLNLTDAQKQQWKDMEKSFRQDNAAFFQSTRQTWQDFRAAKEAGDTAKMDALKPAMESQHAQMRQLRDAQEQKLATILTPDQKAQWDALKAERAARRAQRENKQ
jgi:periplasmic protein CpxP/Spy